MNTLKKDWKPDLGIKHILLTIKCLLIVPNPESALNEEAGKLLLGRICFNFNNVNLVFFRAIRHLLQQSQTLHRNPRLSEVFDVKARGV